MITVTKVKIVKEDIDFGLGLSSQTRVGVTSDYEQVNSTHIPHDATQSIFEAIEDRQNDLENTNTFAPILGNINQAYNVDLATANNHALAKVQFDDMVLLMDALKVDKTEVLQLDNASPYSPSFDYNPATKLFVEQQIDTLETNILLKDNSVIFTPLSDYQPATKKLVDDTVALNNVPIGCCVVYSGIVGSETMNSDWHPCDGTVISNALSPLNGQNSPNYSTEPLDYYIRLT